MPSADPHPRCRPTEDQPRGRAQCQGSPRHVGRGPGSVIPNASTFILSGPHVGRVPSWHRAGTPPGYRANSVVRATIRSTQPSQRILPLIASCECLTAVADATGENLSVRRRKARIFLILWCRAASPPTSSASTTGASTLDRSRGTCHKTSAGPVASSACRRAGSIRTSTCWPM